MPSSSSKSSWKEQCSLLFFPIITAEDKPEQEQYKQEDLVILDREQQMISDSDYQGHAADWKEISYSAD